MKETKTRKNKKEERWNETEERRTQNQRHNKEMGKGNNIKKLKER